MTVEEIKYQIRVLQNMLEEKQKELENQKDEVVGRFYKSGNAIGKIISKSESEDEYTCNELFFYDPENGGTSELQHNTYERNTLIDIEIITPEDFEERFNRRIKRLRNIFNLD